MGGAPVAEKIGEIMGVAGGAAEKKVAFVKCAGTCDKTKVQYNYYGVDDCKKVSVVPGAGEKACAYGCMGYGSCVKACAFDASMWWTAWQWWIRKNVWPAACAWPPVRII